MTPFHEAHGVRIYCADVREWAAQSDEAPFHAMLTDPPYGLGFMGCSWDKQGIAFQPETWAGLLERLHPGAFCFSFASSRGWHRLACAVEDAGFVFHPSVFVLGWVQGQGFPKAARVSENAWEGHRYGRQALKPSVEPILCYQRPYAGKPVECITRTGAGALNIDGGRLKHSEPCRMLPDQHGEAPGNFYRQGGRHGETLALKPEGRWPANCVLQHLPGCIRKGTQRVKGARANGDLGEGVRAGLRADTRVFRPGPGITHLTVPVDADGTEEVAVWACEPGCPVAAFDAQAGERQSGAKHPYQQNVKGWKNSCDWNTYERAADSGPASRFYFNAEWSLEVEERIAGAMPVLYAPKTPRKEREAGLEGVKAITDVHNLSSNACARCGRRVKHNRNGVGCECGELRETVKLPTTTRNPHPTLKPLSICKWLGSLLLPPAVYAPRRILIPFAGTGSEAIGALLAGFEEAVLVEQSEEYCALAVKRIEHWLQVCDRERREAQPSLFGREEFAAE